MYEQISKLNTRLTDLFGIVTPNVKRVLEVNSPSFIQYIQHYYYDGSMVIRHL